MKFTFPPNSTPLAGYTIKRGIHRGGFGEVYYAHTDGGKEVALKLLQSQFEVELRGVRQCLNLKHANLVSLYDIRIDDDGDHWIVMEYVSGRTLADVLEEHPDGLPLEDVTAWIDGMAAGLDFLHDRGIVHRDLKPGNVFVENGVVKIGDVGLSKYISQSRRNEQTQSVGTVYYMAPEVAHGRYGREVDVYSLGIVLYELLTGRVPFEGESTAEILMKHLSEEPDLSVVDRRFRKVIAAALAKDPAKRTASASQLAKDFSHAAARSSARRRTLVGAGVNTEVGGESTPVAPPFPQFEPSPPVPGPTSGPPPSTAVDPSATTNRSDWDRWMLGFLFNAESRANLFRDRPWLPWALIPAAILVLFAAPQLILVLLAILVGRKLWSVFHPAKEKSEPVVEIVSGPPPTASRSRVVRPFRSSELLSPETLRRIPFWQRVTEWSGALAYAAPLTALVTFCLVLATPLLPMERASGWRNLDPGTIGQFALVTLLGSWAVLSSAKFFEGRRVNGLHRRLGYLFVGSLVGVAAFWLHGALLVDLHDGLAVNRPDAMFHQLPHRPLYDASHQPTLHGYMLFFGLLFAVRRWWWHVDGFRPWRFRMWTVAVTSLVGFLLCSVFAFPHLWGTMWAASICCVTQLAAPWMAPEERHELAEERIRA